MTDPTEDPENRNWAMNAYWEGVAYLLGKLSEGVALGKTSVREALDKLKGIVP